MSLKKGDCRKLPSVLIQISIKGYRSPGPELQAISRAGGRHCFGLSVIRPGPMISGSMQNSVTSGAAGQYVNISSDPM